MSPMSADELSGGLSALGLGRALPQATLIPLLGPAAKPRHILLAVTVAREQVETRKAS